MHACTNLIIVKHGDNFDLPLKVVGHPSNRFIGLQAQDLLN